MTETTLPKRPAAERANLATQFILAAAVVVTMGMLIIGFWVTSEIEKGAKDSAAGVTALYVDAMIAPITQDLETQDHLSPENQAALEHLLRQGALQREVSAFKLWDRSGRVVYSDNPALTGRVFTPGKGLTAALAGGVHAGFGHPGHTPAAGEDSKISADKPLEVYSPLRSAATGEVIGVAEFYTASEALSAHLFNTRVKSWLVVGLVSTGMLSVLYLVIARGSRTITSQRQALDAQIGQLSDLLDRNSRLARRIDQANHRIAHLHERYLRRISAELHDGPAQLLAFAALRLDAAAETAPALVSVKDAVNEAMQEIRYICQGFALPELESWSIGDIARRLASTFQARTGSAAGLKLAPDLPEFDPQIALASRTCIYRFIQETLNNAARHAPGAVVTIAARTSGDGIMIEVEDNGPGIAGGATAPVGTTVSHEGLGLPGLRERVTGLKGRFEVISGEERNAPGTLVRMWLPVHSGTDLT